MLSNVTLTLRHNNITLCDKENIIMHKIQLIEIILVNFRMGQSCLFLPKPV